MFSLERGCGGEIQGRSFRAVSYTHLDVYKRQFLDGLSVKDAIPTMTKWLEEKGLGRSKVNYKLRDWVFSRQRYWGEPIPLVYCEKCGWQPIDESELPLLLPDVDSYEPTDNGESPLSKMTEWVNTTCPKCGGPAQRETCLLYTSRSGAYTAQWRSWSAPTSAARSPLRRRWAQRYRTSSVSYTHLDVYKRQQAPCC